MQCTYHSERESVAICVKCLKDLCEECKTPVKGYVYCMLCADDILAVEKTKAISEDASTPKSRTWSATSDVPTSRLDKHKGYKDQEAKHGWGFPVVLWYLVCDLLLGAIAALIALMKHETTRIWLIWLFLVSLFLSILFVIFVLNTNFF